MKFWKLASAATALVFSTSVSASVVNTLNGVEYEWLEITATQGLSRNQVEAQIASSTVGDTLYGYDYASRSLFESLLSSYASWDGINGYHGDSAVASGMASFLVDFGATVDITYGGLNSYTTVDGHYVQYDNYKRLFGYYGLTGECSTPLNTCYTTTPIVMYNGATAVMAHQSDNQGWDANFISPLIDGLGTTNGNLGSFLVREVSPVPVPAAVWLFGSGLIGLAGLARRNKA